MYEYGGKTYASEDEYFDSLKVNDSYHFSIPFEYIAVNHGDGNYEIGTAYMEVDVTWSDSAHEYLISYYSPDAGNIDPTQGNDSVDGFFMNEVYDKAVSQLVSQGVPSNCIQPW